jgi:hypothetical protein
MNRSITSLSILLCLLVLGLGCTSYEYSNKSKSENTFITPKLYEEPLDLASIVAINNPNKTRSRGMVSTDMLIQGANLAVQGVKYLIDESKKKYHQEYIAGLNNQNFYASNSALGSLDPNNIQFRGFSISRSFKDPKSDRQVALKASFSLDSPKFQDLYFNSKFYLILDSISIEYSKVKVNETKWFLPWTWFLQKEKDFNLDMEIQVYANWLDEYGAIHNRVPFGSFVLPLRQIPLDPNAAGYQEYFQNLRGTSLSGASYIIPRSTTFCTNARGKSKSCYGRGDFDIEVTVIESSKEDFVSKMLQDNSDEIFDNIKGGDVIKALQKKN